MLPLHQCRIPDLVNVQVGKTSAWWNGLYHQRQGTCIHVHPFGRASTSVINRPIRAWSLLSPTCPSGDIRAMPSVSRAATPMKPRANPGNRTRQPKGCADRIAKPARLSRASQNHLMMIIPNKTVATTVAQRLHNMIVNRLQSMRRARRRLASVTFYAQTFQKPARYFCYCPTGPGRSTGWGAPRGGGCLLYVQHWNVCVIVFWRVVWYLRGRDRINVAPGYRAWPSYPSCLSHLAVAMASLAVAVVPGCGVPGRRRSRLCGLWTCRRRVAATRRRMLVFPMVLMASHYPDLHNRFVVCIVRAIKQTTTEGTEMKRSPPRRPPPQGR